MQSKTQALNRPAISYPKYVRLNPKGSATGERNLLRWNYLHLTSAIGHLDRLPAKGWHRALQV